jgi:large subunit ribosomal protein L25
MRPFRTGCCTSISTRRPQDPHRQKGAAALQGEENSPAVKLDKCLVSHVVNEIEIECLASALPEFLEIDLGELVKGQSLHLNDIKVPKGVKFVTHGKPNPVIATVVLPKEEEVAAEGEVAATAAAAAPAPAPAKGKGKK